MISQDDRKKFLKFARDSIFAAFHEGELHADAAFRQKFSEKQGVFVTLTQQGELRGCIGFPEPVYPLWQAVASAARSAAFDDPRFMPVEETSFGNIVIEISVLTVPRLIDVKNPEEYLDKIIIGEDGLIIRSPMGAGLLLPQVFTEYACDAQKALEMLCRKAGLLPGAWKNKDSRIYKFQAEIFHEA